MSRMNGKKTHKHKHTLVILLFKEKSELFYYCCDTTYSTPFCCGFAAGKNPNAGSFRRKNAAVEPETARALRADGLGPAELDSLKTLISEYKGFGLLSLVRALMFSGGCRDFMISLMGLALLIGQWAGPIGFIAFKLRSEDVTECPR